MKMRGKNNGWLEYCLDYLFALFTVLQANTLYYNNWGRQITILWLVSCLSLMFGSICNLYKNHTNIASLIGLYLYYIPTSMTLLSILFFFKDSTNISRYIMSFLIVPICVFPILYERCLNGTGYDLFNKIKNIILLLALLSIFGWIFSVIGVPTNSFISSSWGPVSILSGYFHVHFIAQGTINFLGINVIRNTGVFVEAPMFSYVLCVGLLIELFMRNVKHNSVFIISIFIFTIFTTTSTTGIVVALTSLFYYKYITQKSSTFFNLPVAFISLFALFIFIKFAIFNKINPNWASSSSLRMNDYYAGYKAWSQHILLGNGLDNNQSIINYMDPRRIDFNIYSPGMTGFSNGIMQILSFGGIALLTNFYIIPTVIGLLSSKKIAGVALFSFILFCTTIVPMLFIYIIILSFFFINFTLVHHKKRIGINKS